ncbi:MAG: hypothetical protein LBH57_03600, partial [Treponema sp.]|nr:hypothetical protein [Treponema sp.]
MRRNFLPLWGMIVLLSLFYSCSSVPEAGISPEPAPSGTAGIVPEARPAHPEAPGEDVAARPPESPEGPLPETVPETGEEPISEGTAGPLPEVIAALPPEAGPPQEKGRVPERPEFPPTPERILGVGRIPFYGLALFLLSVNPDADAGFIEDLARSYTEEAALEGVNHDV